MDLGLNGKLVLVTGSSKGIGKGIAEAFLREGASVILTARGREDLEATLESLQDQYGSERVLCLQCDLSYDIDLDMVRTAIGEKFGYLDHLVCNIGSGKSVPVLQEDETEFRRVFDVNLFTAQKTVSALLPLIEKAEAGSITFISSICGCETLGCPTAYSAAKAALNAYAATIARPLGKKNVRVNTISPGNVLFPGSTWEDKLQNDEQAVHAMLDREVPLNRLGTLEEIADTVVFLTSAKASFVTGANWIVDGGQTRS